MSAKYSGFNQHIVHVDEQKDTIKFGDYMLKFPNDIERRRSGNNWQVLLVPKKQELTCILDDGNATASLIYRGRTIDNLITNLIKHIGSKRRAYLVDFQRSRTIIDMKGVNAHAQFKAALARECPWFHT